jgi:hypothetical protein
MVNGLRSVDEPIGTGHMAVSIGARLGTPFGCVTRAP